MSDTIRVAVDRREGQTICVVGDDGRAWDVPAASLRKDCRAEGAVLDVPLTAAQAPDWAAARRNRDEERRRLREASERLERLRRRDPGGDVSL